VSQLGPELDVRVAAAVAWRDVSERLRMVSRYRPRRCAIAVAVAGCDHGLSPTRGWHISGGDYWQARELSAIAGAGLSGFEAAELAWMGFQPLEALSALVGLIISLAWRTRSRQEGTM
jgi:hypothetical protein